LHGSVDEEGAMASWYVAYKNCAGSVMHVYGHRDAAIAAACELLAQGLNVTEVAPMAGELPESVGLDAAEIRRISEQRMAAIGRRQREPA
jgi:hypothetical protein